MPRKIGNSLFNNVPHRIFQYKNVTEFVEEMDKISKEADVKNIKKITIKFFSKNNNQVVLNYYNLVEFLLFVNGMKIVKII